MSIHKTATNTPVGCAEERSASIANDALHTVQHILRDIPKSWEIKKIKEFAHITSGGTPKRSNSEYFGGNIPWVKSGDLNDGMLFECEENITEQGLNNSSAKLFKAGTLLIALYGATIGRLSILNFEAATNQAVCGISVPDNVDVKYLFYFLLNSRRNLIEQGKGGAQPNINQYIVNEIEVPLAPFDQQNKIVAKIEELFSHIDAGVVALQKAKQLLKQYRQSVLKAAVTGELTRKWREQNKNKLEPASELLKRILAERQSKWEEQQLEQFKAQGKVPKDDKWKLKYIEPEAPVIQDVPELTTEWQYIRLDALTDIQGGITVDSKRSAEDTVRLPYLRVANVQRGFLDLSEIKEINVPKDRVESLSLKDRDILFNEGGDRDKLGRGWVWHEEVKNCTYQNHVFRARPYSSWIVSEFVSIFGNTFGQEYFIRQGKQTTNLASINKTKLSAFPVPLCSEAEMKIVISLVDEKLMIIDRTASIIDTQLLAAAKNKQSILSKSFSGGFYFE